VSDEVQPVVCVQAQVRDQQIRSAVADVLPRRDEITARSNISDSGQHTLQGHSASDVGFDD
jgi:hypothetical protein